jgi:hypothetical protein
MKVAEAREFVRTLTRTWLDWCYLFENGPVSDATRCEPRQPQELIIIRAAPQFPGRDLIMLCAFCVVLGTLVIQGLALRPLLRLLRLQDNCRRRFPICIHAGIHQWKTTARAAAPGVLVR